MTRIPSEYEASGPEWHGGRIIVTRDSEGYGISQIFGCNEGPFRNGGNFPLGYQKTGKAAHDEAAVHCRARKLKSFFVEVAI